MPAASTWSEFRLLSRLTPVVLLSLPHQCTYHQVVSPLAILAMPSKASAANGRSSESQRSC